MTPSPAIASPTILLNDDTSIPQLGFGTYKIVEYADDVVKTAIDVGYRHLDTARLYGNEKEVGDAVRASGLSREKFYITTKLQNGRHHDVRQAFEESLADLDLEYIDLYLIHWPMPSVSDYVQTWKQMVDLLQTGKVRSVGVSNFTIEHLEKIIGATGVIPAVNQVELHPFLTQTELVQFHQAYGIATEAWSPIARGKISESPTIVAIADKHGVTPAQATLRWHIQLGHIVFPKSTHRVRMEENADIFSFSLSEDEIAAISACDTHTRYGPDPEVFVD